MTHGRRRSETIDIPIGELLGDGFDEATLVHETPAYREYQTTRNGKECTLWRVRTHQFDDEVTAAEFVSATRRTQVLHHRSLRSVYDVWQERTRVFVQCEPLDLLHDYSPETGDVLGLKKTIRDVGAAVEILHGSGLFHGYLSPRYLGQRDDGTIVVSGGGILGAIPRAVRTQWEPTIWMAPEVLRSGFVTEAADVFSVAALFATVVVGRPMENLGQVLDVLEVKNKRAWDVVQQALSRNPKERGTASELFQALAEWTDNPEVVRKDLIQDEVVTRKAVNPLLDAGVLLGQAVPVLPRAQTADPVPLPGLSFLDDDEVASAVDAAPPMDDVEIDSSPSPSASLTNEPLIGGAILVKEESPAYLWWLVGGLALALAAVLILWGLDWGKAGTTNESIVADGAPVQPKVLPVAKGTANSCLAGMVEVGDFCMDKHEYIAEGEELPLMGVSMKEAASICQQRGARLCTDKEWELGCRGPVGASWPYGVNYEKGVCNVRDVDDIVAPGSYSRCVGRYGTYDMSGNAAEWVSSGNVRGSSAVDDGNGRCSRIRESTDEESSKDVGFRCCSAISP